MSKFERMTVPELDSEIEQLMAHRAALRAQQQEAVRVRDRKRAVLSVERKVEGFTPAEQDVLSAVIAPEGIASEEQVGGLRLPEWMRRLLHP